MTRHAKRTGRNGSSMIPLVFVTSLCLVFLVSPLVESMTSKSKHDEEQVAEIAAWFRSLNGERRGTNEIGVDQKGTNEKLSSIDISTSEDMDVNVNSKSGVDQKGTNEKLSSIDISTSEDMDVNVNSKSGVDQKGTHEKLSSIDISTSEDMDVNVNSKSGVDQKGTNEKLSSIDISTSEDMDVNVNSKSELYRNIYEEIPTLDKNPFSNPMSCRDRCGSSIECSCKPICLFFKTCCVDFVEACGDVYDIDQFLEEYNWLRSVSVECVDNSLVVASCRNDSDYQREENLKFSSQNIDFLEHSLLPSSSQDLYQDDRKNEDINLSLQEVLHLISSMSHEELEDLDEAGRILLTTPILDSSTGISYKNLSLYDCNEANLTHGLPWLVNFPLHDSSFLPSSKIKSIQDIIILTNSLNTSDRFPLRLSRHISDENVELCRDNYESTCPASYTDKDVESACKNTNFFVEAFNMSLRDSLPFKKYKNPFCVVCNLGLSPNIQRLRISKVENIVCDRCQYQKRLRFMFPSYNEGYALDITHSYKVRAISFAWTTLSCKYLTSGKHLNNGTFISNTGGSSRENAIQLNTTRKKHLSSVCHVSGCISPDDDDVCRVVNNFIIGLPPSENMLQNYFLANFVEKLAQILIDIVPGAIAKNDTSFRTYSTPQTLYGYDFQYFFRIGLHSESYITPVATLHLLGQPFLALMQGFQFPYKNDNNYLCLTTSTIMLNKRIDANSINCRKAMLFDVFSLPSESANAAPLIQAEGETWCVCLLPILLISVAPTAWLC